MGHLLLLGAVANVGALTRVHLARHQLLRLQAFLISAARRGLSSLALTDGVLLCFLELAAIHVLGCVGCPET